MAVVFKLFLSVPPSYFLTTPKSPTSNFYIYRVAFKSCPMQNLSHLYILQTIEIYGYFGEL